MTGWLVKGPSVCSGIWENEKPKRQENTPESVNMFDIDVVSVLGLRVPSENSAAFSFPPLWSFYAMTTYDI